jgi:hypothetical protein
MSSPQLRNKQYHKPPQIRDQINEPIKREREEELFTAHKVGNVRSVCIKDNQDLGGRPPSAKRKKTPAQISPIQVT